MDDGQASPEMVRKLQQALTIPSEESGGVICRSCRYRVPWSNRFIDRAGFKWDICWPCAFHKALDLTKEEFLLWLAETHEIDTGLVKGYREMDVIHVSCDDETWERIVGDDASA